MFVRLDATGVQPRKLRCLGYIGHDIRWVARAAWTTRKHSHRRMIERTRLTSATSAFNKGSPSQIFPSASAQVVQDDDVEA